MSNAGLSSAPVGRKPSDNPLNVPISFRIDEPTAELLLAELERLKRERAGGLGLSRNDVARELMMEALLARMEKLTAKRKK